MVHVIVCIKQVIDVSQIKVDKVKRELMLQGVPLKISDFDNNALEEGIRLKEKLGGKVTVLTLGGEKARESVKKALACGADEGVLLNDPGFEALDYLGVSEVLAAAINKIGEYDMIICGEASVDQFSGQMGPRLAGILGLPQITYVRKLDAESDKVVAEKDVGDKLVVVESKYPLLITVTKEINEYRMPTLFQIMGAAKKPLEIWDAAALGLTPEVLEGFRSTEMANLTAVSMDRLQKVMDGEVSNITEELVNELLKAGITVR